MPQFVRNSKTGEVGYWDGQRVIPLSNAGNQALAHTSRGGDVRVNVDPSLPGAAEDAKLIQQLTQMARGGQTDLREFEATPKAQPSPVETPSAQRRSETIEMLKQVAPTAAAAGVSALTGGAATGLAASLIRGGGPIARIARMVAGGAGGYGAEKLNQALGLSEGGEGSAALSAALGAVPGFFKPGLKEVTSDERIIQRLKAAKPVANEAAKLNVKANQKYKLARAGKDVNSEQLLQPLDDLIMREMNTPNFEENIVERMMGLRDSLVNRITIMRENIPTQATSTAIVEEPPINTIEGLMHRLRRAMPGANQPATNRKVTGVKFDMPKNVNPENLVDDLKQMQDMAQDAERAGRTDLAKQIRVTYKQIAQRVPNLPEGDEAYAQSKALRRGAKAIRSSGTKGLENLLEDSVKSGGLTDVQRTFLRQQAAKSDRVGGIVQRMLNSPIGIKLLNAGINPQGTVNPTAWSAALQIGARMAGLGEGDETSVEASY